MSNLKSVTNIYGSFVKLDKNAIRNSLLKDCDDGYSFVYSQSPMICLHKNDDGLYIEKYYIYFDEFRIMSDSVSCSELFVDLDEAVVEFIKLVKNVSTQLMCDDFQLFVGMDNPIVL